MGSAACNCQHRYQESPSKPDIAASFRHCAHSSTACVLGRWLTNCAGVEPISAHDDVFRANSSVVNSHDSASVLNMPTNRYAPSSGTTAVYRGHAVDGEVSCGVRMPRVAYIMTVRTAGV